MNQFRRPTQLGPKKCPVYLHLPLLGNVLMRLTAVKRSYFAVERRIVYITRQLLPAAQKDVLPALHQSNIVYQFLCHCDSRYVGRTSQRLQQRIKQHVPKTFLQGRIFLNTEALWPALASQSEALKLKLPFCCRQGYHLPTPKNKHAAVR